MVATRTIIVSLLLGTSITLLASILPARRATRVPPIAAVREGSRPAADAVRRALGQHRPRRDARVAGRDRARDVRRWRQRRRVALLIGRRRARAVHGHRAARPAPREAARPRRGLAGASRRRRRRRPGRRQRRPQPGPHRVDRGRAHDRAHARDRRGGARLRHQRGRPRRPSPTSSTPTTSSTATRTCRSGPTRATSSRRSPGVKAASHVRSDQAIVAGQGERRSAASTPPRSRASTRSMDAGLRAHAGPARHRRRARDQGLRQGRAPEARQQLSLKTPSGAKRTLAVRGIYDPPEATRCWATSACRQQALRQGVHPAQEQPHVPRRRRRRGGRRSRPRPRASATRSSTRAPSIRRTPPRTCRSSWRCSTCCWASRSS